MINTVLGRVSENEINAVLCHEHVCCYSEYLWKMSGKKLFNENELLMVAVKQLRHLNDKYGMNLFIDCTPVNIGRNVKLLRKLSRESGVYIVCSTGFYYTEEAILFNTPVDTLTEYYIRDALHVNAGIIKVAVESEFLSEFNKKLITASANTQRNTGLPIVLHTNAKNKNGIRALDMLLDKGVPSSAITVGHLSDTEDFDYVKKIAGYGCYVGLDRLYKNTSEDYIQRKIATINTLIDAGFVGRIILSHDDLIYNGFDSVPQIGYNPRFNYVFDNILNRLKNDVAETIIRKNPIRMLNCQ